MHLCRQGHMTSCLPREPGEPLCFICVDFKRNRSSGYEGASQRAGGAEGRGGSKMLSVNQLNG